MNELPGADVVRSLLVVLVTGYGVFALIEMTWLFRPELFVRGRDEPFVMAGGETRQSGESDAGSANSDVEVLRSGREEARVVLDHQIQLLNETHAKAVRTVRITGVVFGLVLSMATIPAVGQFVNEFTVAGIGLLVLAILSGLVTYTASRPEFGVGEDYLLDARVGSYSEPEWFGVLLEGYREWIEYMENLNDRNSKLLTSTQLFLGLGIALLAAGATIGVLAG